MTVQQRTAAENSVKVVCISIFPSVKYSARTLLFASIVSNKMVVSSGRIISDAM